jgi:hypothetical protein
VDDEFNFARDAWSAAVFGEDELGYVVREIVYCVVDVEIPVFDVNGTCGILKCYNVRRGSILAIERPEQCESVSTLRISRIAECLMVDPVSLLTFFRAIDSDVASCAPFHFRQPPYRLRALMLPCTGPVRVQWIR